MKQTFSGTVRVESGTTTATQFTSSILKASWFIISLTVISFFALQSVTALEISLESPSEAELDEEFTVSISADSTEVYDVKVFVHKSDDNKIDRNEYISEIYNGGWADSYLYIKESFPEEIAYKVKVVESPGQREICARLRKSGTSAFFTQCNAIEITGSENSEEDEEETDEDHDDKEVEEDREVIKSSEAVTLSETAKKETPSPPPQPSFQEQERILLSSKPLKKTDFQNSIVTPEGTKRKVLVYSFTGFCVLIIFLLALKKL